MPTSAPIPSGDFAVGDNRTRTTPALHVGADGIPQHVHDRATVVRRAEDRRAALDAQSGPVLADALAITRETLATRIDDPVVLEHATRNLVQALAPLFDRPANVPTLAGPLMTVIRALRDSGCDRDFTATYARVVVDALATGGHLR